MLTLLMTQSENCAVDITDPSGSETETSVDFVKGCTYDIKVSRH